MKNISKFCAAYAVAFVFTLYAHAASAWIFTSDVDSDSRKWSKYFDFNSDPAGADRFINMYDNMFVRVWADKNTYSSAGRTVSIPSVPHGFCFAQITHTGSTGYFYVRDSATYTTLSPLKIVPSSLYLPHNRTSTLQKITTSFSASDKKVFARFYMPGARERYQAQYGIEYNKKTAYIDNLFVFCM